MSDDMTSELSEELDFGNVHEEKFSEDYWCSYTKQNINAQNDVHVFIGACPVEQLKKNKDIMLVDDLRGEELWGMHKIVQRNISVERVDSIVKEYLRTKNKPIKFFPAITVVLLPVENNQPKEYYSNDEEGFLSIDGIYAKNPQKNVGGVLKNFPAKLKWSVNKIAALVVDGQHRVKAVRDYYDTSGQGAGSENSLPVAFVVFDNKHDLSVIDSTRQLFIDINNTPKRVSEQKLIFIDDRNILRRLTAKTLGVLDAGDQSDDPYQEFEDKQCFFDTGDVSFLNKYLVGEDGNDDEELKIRYRSHDSLFPWEVTHIMTLHEEVIKKILLADKEIVDGLPSLRKLSRIIHRNTGSFVEAAAADDLTDVKIKNKTDDLRSKGLPEGEVEVLRRLMYINQDFRQQLELVDNDAEGASEEIDENKVRLERALNSEKSFEYPVKSAMEIANGETKKVIEIVAGVFGRLKFVREINDLFFNGDSGVSKTQLFRYVAHSKQKYSGLASSENEKRAISLEGFFESNDVADKEADALRAKTQEMLDKKNDNILSMLVGQQALFGWLALKDNENRGNLSFLHENYCGLVDKVNSLYDSGFFSKSKKLSLSLFGEEFKFSAFEGLLLKGERMAPGANNAKKAAYFIDMVCNGSCKRKQVEESPAGSVRQFENIIKSMGSRGYGFFSDKKNVQEISEELISTFDISQLIRSDDVEKLNSEDVTIAVKESMAKKALGALMLEKVVDEYYPSAKLPTS
ncbi:DNA sulfur modification protein DndB [Halomonas sp. THAF12]|uniref:DNA sulfur modification protein DndB n=1 Tax=Halomonas sp. B23F22_10 TaxID=3459515 RepID=UPI00373EB302